MTLSQIGVIPHVCVKVQVHMSECILQYLICTDLHPHGALLVNLLGHRADLKMLSAHIYKHSHSCNYVSLITDKLSTTTLYLELHWLYDPPSLFNHPPLVVINECPLSRQCLAKCYGNCMEEPVPNFKSVYVKWLSWESPKGQTHRRDRFIPSKCWWRREKESQFWTCRSPFRIQILRTLQVW